MALVAASARALLAALLSWCMHCSAELAKHCAEELALLYEAIADHKVCIISVSHGPLSTLIDPNDPHIGSFTL